MFSDALWRIMTSTSFLSLYFAAFEFVLLLFSSGDALAFSSTAVDSTLLAADRPHHEVRDSFSPIPSK